MIDTTNIPEDAILETRVSGLMQDFGRKAVMTEYSYTTTSTSFPVYLGYTTELSQDGVVVTSVDTVTQPDAIAVSQTFIDNGTY